ncbi:type II toxin-antitoxin system RelE/ParE family toxin [Psychrosphaera haliotis]|uniref:Toxin n=1 Tax=Psychrosphaera haliotis TaxID=555083 RepID=A0A6N8FAL7_9GAMM|nr:type II toxin-antitoxin system RelE/ParE family toxin [Psychrosphaera haliotis]
MTNYVLSQLASKDLANIFQYTYRNFNLAQAESYLLELEECFKMLAHEPNLAHKADDVRKGYFRFLHRKHAVYFKSRSNDIFVVRILHQQMKYELHLTS